MPIEGFYISKLSVTGDGREPAVVNFFPGLNVITGLSDTGKSYIFSAINYIFGGKDTPEAITEAQGYEEIWLELKPFESDNIYTLQRGFNSNIIRLYQCGINEIGDSTEFKDLKTVHKGDKIDNVSAFLLQQSGFPITTNLAKNQKGETSTFTFRVLWDFISANEIEILKKESPILNGRNTDDTRQRNAFIYLLTGRREEKKYRAPTEKQKVENAHLAGQIELCKRMIENLNHSIASLEKERKRFGDIHQIEIEIEKLTDQVDRDAGQVSAMLDKRNEILDELEEQRNKIRSITQMQSRFNILRQHYKSDLSRLDFISEGHFLISQLQSSMCPACGKPLSDTTHKHASDSTIDDESIQEACKQEIGKIQTHLEDLEKTFSDLQAEQTKLEKKCRSLENDSDKLEIVLRDELRVTWSTNRGKLEELLSFRSIEHDYINASKQLVALQQTQAELTKKAREDVSLVAPVTKEPTTDKQEDDFKDASTKFARRIGNYLKKWKFSDETVTFNEDTWDIQIGEKQRKSFGKGKRGVLFAAFHLALMSHCISHKRPHPRFVLLDSPLTAHKGKLAEQEDYEEEELLPEEVQEEFFSSLASWKKDRQIIILDNKVPTAKAQDRSNTIVFSGDDSEGRFGFFPTAVH